MRRMSSCNRMETGRYYFPVEYTMEASLTSLSCLRPHDGYVVGDKPELWAVDHFSLHRNGTGVTGDRGMGVIA